jgi:tetratricopeptide (TPR) repeat protein
MKARHIKHIVMIYNRFEEEKAELFSTFFRLMGVYVLLMVRETINERTDLSYKDFMIVLNDNGENEWIRDGFRKDNWIPFKMDVLHRGEGAAEADIQILFKLLDAMRQSPLGGEFEDSVFDDLKNLASIYAKCNLLLYNYHLRLVSVRDEDKERTFMTAIEHFQEAISMAEEWEGKTLHSFYFRQECRRKVNLVCRLAGRLKYYGTQRMMDENLEYLNRDSEATCLWTLTGLIADEDDAKAYMAINCYRRHIEEEQGLGNPEDEKFQGYIYYRMGRYYEKIDLNWKKALRCYETAYRRAPSNYRFAYKVAFSHETFRNFNQAEKYYDAIIDQMQPYIEEGYITPCKCEYAFKVARRLMIVGTRQEQYLYARKMAQLAIRIWESIPGNKFIDRFYTDEEAKSIKEGMQQRLAIRRTMEELEDIEKIIKYNW